MKKLQFLGCLLWSVPVICLSQTVSNGAEQQFRGKLYWPNSFSCYMVYGDNLPQALKKLEGTEGRRITGFDHFSGGVSINFMEGPSVPAFYEEIDCKERQKRQYGPGK